MRFLLDSCVSSFAVKDLRDAGFDVLWLPEIGKDPGDDAIMQKAFDGDFILVTVDKDFGELVFVFGKPHPAIIRLVGIPARNQGKVLLRLISTHRADIEKKALITVDKCRIRVCLPD
ncbi:MAG TPA: toxin-antitoxin system, toxin component, PIN family protein [Nitrospiraceae bacterium]|nr:toxin-antitoxin system, toxin component, PIN family protein [Nitrospiraceae bacterium]